LTRASPKGWAILAAFGVMFAAVGLQVVSVIILGLVAGLAFDWTSAKFFVLGGMAAVVPNALFALRLALQRGRSPESYPAVFFLGEFAKIGLTVGLVAWIVHAMPDVNWLALVLGLIVALKAPLFALLVVRDAPRDWPPKGGSST
jgi:ATP synthase protein I